jgi:hypothetical protein
MNPYSASTMTQRTVAGRLWKIVVILSAAGAGCYIAAIFYCSGHLNRDRAKEAIAAAHQAETVGQLDRALLPLFEKEFEGNGRVTYSARPFGEGVCGCSPAFADTVEATLDSQGGVTKLSVSQSLGLSRKAPGR